MPLDPPPVWPSFGPLVPPPIDIQYGNNQNPSGGVVLQSPGGGAVPNFPWDAVLPTLTGTPAPSQVAGNKYGPPGAKLECATVGARHALAYGTVRLIGRRLYQEDNDTASANFATGFTVGPIQGFVKYFANGIDVTSSTGYSFSSYNGTTPQSSDSWLTSIFPGATLAGTSWFRAFVQITGIVPPGGWRTIMPGDSSQIEWGADLQGLLLWDPRSATTYWSNNPALVIWDLLVRIGGFSSSDLDPVTFGAAADICDTLVGSPSAKRFIFDGAFTEEDSLQQMLNSVRMTCNGEIYMEDGLIKLWVDVENAGSPVLALDEKTNFEHVGYSWIPAEDQPTRVIIEFPNKDLGYKLDYKTVDSPLLAGGSVDQKVVTMRAEGCVDEVHAGRIGTYIVNQSTTPLRIAGDASFAAAILSRGSKVSLVTGTGLTSSSHFLVLETNRKEGGLRALTLRQYNAAVYADAAVGGTLPPYTGPPPFTDPFATPPDVLKPVLTGSGVSFGLPRVYDDPTLYTSSYWSHVNVTSWDATKINDGSTSSGSAGSYGPSATSRMILTLPAAKKFAKLRFDVNAGSFDGFGPFWIADYPRVEYSDNGSSWTAVANAVATCIRSSTDLTGWIVEFDIPAAAHVYWRINVGFGSAGATVFIKEAQFYTVSSAPTYRWLSHFEVHAGISAATPLFATVQPPVPTSANPLNVEGARYFTNVPFTGAGALNGAILRYCDLYLVTVNVLGVKSAGVYLYSMGLPGLDTFSPPLSEYPEYSAGLPAVAGSGKARIVSQGGAARLSENGGAYKPFLTKGGVTSGVTLQASTPGTADSGNVNIAGVFMALQAIFNPNAAGSTPLKLQNVTTPTVDQLIVLLGAVTPLVIDKIGSLKTLEASRIAPWVEPRVSCSAQLAINSTTATDITGATITFTPPSDCRAEIHFVFDVRRDSGSNTFVGELVVNGTAQAAQALFNLHTTDDRMTVGQTVTVALTGGTSYTIKLTGRVDATPSAFTVLAGHTGFTFNAKGRL